MHRWSIVIAAGIGILLLSHSARAETQAVNPPIFGSKLMTNEERDQYRERMRAAQTIEERERIRREHHQAMRERARAQGISLPDDPPARGGGYGSNGGRPGVGKGPDGPRPYPGK